LLIHVDPESLHYASDESSPDQFFNQSENLGIGNQNFTGAEPQEADYEAAPRLRWPGKSIEAAAACVTW
jgi:hypothetical protein